MRVRASLALLLALVVATGLAHAADIPALSTRVTDTTGTLDAAAIARIESPLAALEARKGAQLAVLVVPTTAPETIEAYAVRAFEQWKLGRAGIDDGVLLVVAKDDRTVRIEVGYGLEGAIPDAVAYRVIQEYLVPHLREGDFAGGIEAAVGVLGSLVEGEALPAPMVPASAAGYSGGEDGRRDAAELNERIASFLMPFVVVFVLVRAFLEGMIKSWWRRGFVGGTAGALALGFIAHGAAPLATLVGFGYVVGFVFFALRTSGGRRGGGYARSGSYGGGSSRSSSRSSGGSRSWSGGGGRSGGGGASGRW